MDTETKGCMMSTHVPPGFTVIEKYSYRIVTPEAWYKRDSIVTADLLIERDPATGEFYVKSLHLHHNKSFANWGWFQRNVRGATLAEVKEQIEAHLLDRIAGFDEAEAADKAARAERDAYNKELEAWELEQLDRVELVPIDEIAEGEDKIAAVIHNRHEIAEAFAVEQVYNKAYYDGGQITYRLMDSSTYHASDRDFDRYVKAGSKVRAIRSFSRPRPERP